jgi:hypothetical protein
VGDEFKPGSRWRSAVCDTEVIVVKAPTAGVVLECGGRAMVAAGQEPPARAALDPALADGTAAGKRFEDTESGLEVLCTKAGAGSLSVDGVPIRLKDAKPLPSSD